MKTRREVLREVRSFEDLPAALRWTEDMARKGLGKGPVAIRLSRPTRSLDQNARLWPMLDDLSKQVDWYGQHLAAEEWKDVFTAALKRLKVVPGLDGGFVVVGAHTSTMTVREMVDLQDLIAAFGAEHGVKWSEKK